MGRQNCKLKMSINEFSETKEESKTNLIDTESQSDDEKKPEFRAVNVIVRDSSSSSEELVSTKHAFRSRQIRKNDISNNKIKGNDDKFLIRNKRDLSHKHKKRKRRGKFCVIFIPILFLIHVLVGLLYIIPYISSNIGSKLLIILIGLILVVVSLMAYFKAAYSHPGIVPKLWREWEGNMYSKPKDPPYTKPVNIKGASLVITKYSQQYCQKCKIYRPLRTYHCSACNACVTRLDHHCIFINNCVGINNHRYFMQFMVYTWISLCYYILLMIMSVIERSNNDKICGNVFQCFFDIISVVILPIICVIFIVFLSVMIFTQIMLIRKNETFLEKKINRGDFKNDKILNKINRIFFRFPNKNDINNDKLFESFKKDRFYLNFIEVFGKSIIKWFLPLNVSENELKIDRMVQHNYSCLFAPCNQWKLKLKNININNNGHRNNIIKRKRKITNKQKQEMLLNDDMMNEDDILLDDLDGNTTRKTHFDYNQYIKPDNV